jgi:ferritin
MEKPRMLKRPETRLVGLENEIMDITTPSAGTTKDMPSTKTMNPLIDNSCTSHLNYRVQQEEYSGRIYMSMSMWLNNKGYVGAAALWKTYSDEEMKHADIARTYLLSFGIQPVTPRLDQPKQNFTGLPEIVKLSFDHEIEVSKQIKNMANHALSDGDHMLYELCLAYLKEQVEEHNKMQNWMDQLEAFGTDKVALRLLDTVMAG